MSSTHWNMVLAVKPIIEKLGLGEESGHTLAVHPLRLGNMVQIEDFPCIVLIAMGNETADGGTCGKDDLGYPVTVWLVDREPSEDVTLEDSWLLWRQVIRNKFINQRQLGASNGFPSVYMCKWEPGPIKDPGYLRDYMKLVGAMTLRFLSRETRGP